MSRARASLIATCLVACSSGGGSTLFGNDGGTSWSDDRTSGSSSGPAESNAPAATTRDASRDAEREDAREGDAAVAGDGGAAPSKCATLATCCSWLGSGHPRFTTCESIVDNGISSACSGELTSMHAAGYCGADTECTSLSACCAVVPSSNTSYCYGFVNDKSELECARIHQSFRTEHWCN